MASWCMHGFYSYSILFLSFSLSTTLGFRGDSTDFRWSRSIQHSFPSRFVSPSSSQEHTLGNLRVTKSGVESIDVCVIGAGVSGLVAAAEAAKNGDKVVLLEASADVGGRVRSEVTEDGFVLDVGFAVFVEEYPMAKSLLNYETLDLGQFLPGALVKLDGRDELALVTDPLRQPSKLLQAFASPVGSIGEKIALFPLVLHCRTTSIENIFQQDEMDAMSSLKTRWGAGDSLLNGFIKPFMEGVFLTSLNNQSSRMFEFVFKMFSEGSVSLPRGGIGAVSKQLADRARQKGADIRLNSPVTRLALDSSNGDFDITLEDSEHLLRASHIICATEGPRAQELLSTLPGLEDLSRLPKQPHRSVGCLYYAFEGEPPVDQPILILNGIGKERGRRDHPINNLCFPSVVSDSYAPPGQHLCSVTVLETTMDRFGGDFEELDVSVRKELASWFPNYSQDILDKWVLLKVYDVKNAQPSQLDGPAPATAHGGRENDKFMGKTLPDGVFVCGDHMSTATLNGAMQSGLAAGSKVLALCNSSL